MYLGLSTLPHSPPAREYPSFSSDLVSSWSEVEYTPLAHYSRMRSSRGSLTFV